jgi:hypothetical protein
VEADDAAHDVDDGVDGAHLVEVDLVRGGPVDGSLDLGQAAKERGAAGLDLALEPAGVEKRQDIGQAAVNVRVAGRPAPVDDDVELAGLKARAIDPAQLQPVARDRELAQLGPEGLERQPEVQESPQDHVARGPRGRVEVGEAAQTIPRSLRLT